MSRFQRKFNVGDLVRPNKRAPKRFASMITEPSPIKEFASIAGGRTHLMYYVYIPSSHQKSSIGFYSDELVAVAPEAKLAAKPATKLTHVGRDALGRFCKLQNTNQLELPLIEFDVNVFSSSLIAKIKYELNRSGSNFGTLSISFVSSPETHYVYYDVPRNTANGLRNAVSKGRYYHENIKGKFLSDVRR